jgi:hypothetical protein
VHFPNYLIANQHGGEARPPSIQARTSELA